MNISVTKPYLDEKEEKAVLEALRSGWIAQGPKVAEFEQSIAEHEGCTSAVATTSCTTALHLALVALGVSTGFDVLVPSFTFVATANSVVMCGATPILVDINSQTYTIDPESVRQKIKRDYEIGTSGVVNRKSGNRLWGIIAVHQFGLCADMKAINEIAQDYQLQVLEDAACALGAKIGNTHQGGFGNVSCISFHPRKSITTGEGGMVLTNDESLATKMRQLRTHGSTISADARHAGKGYLLPKFPEAGYNYRMTDIQAAVGVEQAKKLDFILEERRRRAGRYQRLLCENVNGILPPHVPEDYYHTYQSYVCRLDMDGLNFSTVEQAGAFRNHLLDTLEKLGIATRQGTHAVHTLGYYSRTYGYQPEDLPESYLCDRLSITLPLYVQMTDEEQDYVVHTLQEQLQRSF